MGVNRGKWLRSLVNINEANKQAKIYVGRPLTLKHLLFYAHCLYVQITSLQLFHWLVVLLYIELTVSFLIGQKRTVNFRNQRM